MGSSGKPLSVSDNSGDGFWQDLSMLSSSVIASNCDILEQILIFLPVKTLLKLKLVSQQWFRLISDPIFIQNHFLPNYPSVPPIFLQKLSFVVNPEFEFIFLDKNLSGSSTVPFQTLTFVNDPAGIKIEQSCNGLLICSSFRMNGIGRTYYVYNPSTRRSKSISGSSQVVGDEFHSICNVSLAFNPLKSPHYEVVRIWGSDSNKYQTEIYSSKTGSWRAPGVIFCAPNDAFGRSGVYWNGCLHWISLRESSLYYDINQEMFKTLPMPPIPNGRDRRRIEYFGEYKGHMHLIEMYGPFSTSFDILHMETDYSGWNVKYRVNLEGLATAYPGMVRDIVDVSEYFYLLDFSILLVAENEEEKEEPLSPSLVIVVPDNKVISYNLREMSFKNIHTLSPGIHARYRWFDAYRHIETLAHV
ncbi:F-box protein At5g07610-like [Papaver somniferum]|uniref:F-box protein At5g07610-like n=1 Tax=Papaver somniferum TaxID=3469 RepID=UPI000E7058C5|nr:F-box protein At5g07610-like [Papaver somniferum]